MISLPVLFLGTISINLFEDVAASDPIPSPDEDNAAL
jgi:hypothetical protein